MPTTTTAQVDPEVQRYFDNVLLDREEPDFVHLLFAQERNLPLKNSKTVVHRRYANLTDALTELTEGVSPASEQASKTDILVEVASYGKVVELSDDVLIYVQDRTSNEIADMLRQNRDSTYDKIVRDMVIASASQFDAVNGNNGNPVTEINATDVDLVVDFLEGNNAKKVSPVIEGRNGQGTAPVGAAYWGISHTDIRSDIKNMTNFVPTKQYSVQEPVLQSELGDTDEVRWVKTSEASVDTTASPDEYPTIMCGANAYSTVEVDDLSMEMIIKPLGAGDDALNQRQTMGWKGKFGTGIIDDGWIAILNVTH